MNASREVFPPFPRFDVTAVRLRTWIEECRGALSQLGSPRPPRPAICQPASTTDSQPLVVLLPCGDPSLSSEPGRCFSARLLGYPLAGQRVCSLVGEVSLVFASFVLQLPFKTYGENGQTSAYKPNFPAANTRRIEIPAGKSTKAAVSPR